MVFIEVNNFFPYFLFILMRQRPINMTKTAISPPRVSLHNGLYGFYGFFSPSDTNYREAKKIRKIRIIR